MQPRLSQANCCRTLKGAQDFCTLRYYRNTLQGQGHPLFEVLRAFDSFTLNFTNHFKNNQLNNLTLRSGNT